MPLPVPASRLFVVLGLSVLAVAASVVAPWLLVPILVFDVLVLAAALVDARLANRIDLTARRILPEMLVQGARDEWRVELETSEGSEVQLFESLHPALAKQPERTGFAAPSEATGAQEVLRWRYEIEPLRRGDHECGPLVARVLGPWRLAWAQRILVPTEKVRVYPQIRWGGRVGQLLQLAQRNQLGRVMLTRPGEGGELYSVRTYQRGDPRNRIHWKASARRGQLVTREDSWERGAPMVILLDCGRSMATMTGSRSKLDYALAAALALTRVAVARGDKVTLLAFSDRIERRVRVRSARGGIAKAYSELFDLETRLVEPVYDLAAEQLLALGLPRSTIVLFSSVIDLAAAELLRDSLLELGRRHRTLFMNLEDPVIETMVRSQPRDAAEAFAKLSSLDIVLENRALAHRLRRGGVRAASASADQLALETLETYLELLGGRVAA